MTKEKKGATLTPISKPRHVVLLVADSLRYDAFHDRADSHLPFAYTHGLRFHQARAAGCWTLPATAAIFTGLMPHEHRATCQSRGLRQDVPTLAERMKLLGYHPYMISANVVTTDIFGLHRGFERMECVWRSLPTQKRLQTLMVLAGKPRLRRKLYSVDFIMGKMSADLEAAKVWLQSSIDVVFSRALALLDDAHRRGKRTFCFLNLMETHFPYHINHTFKTSTSTLMGKLRELYSLFHLVNQSWLIRNKEYISPDMLRHLRQRQRWAWAYIAERVDAFIKELREHYQALVVFASDHGDNFGEQGWQYHFSNVNDAGTRVPLLWLWHDRDAVGDIETPVSTRDLYGALLKAAGDTDPSFFSMTDTPDRSITVMQSYWYNNRGRTRPCFQYNQFAFVAGSQRYLHRRDRWYSAPITRRDEPEVTFELLDASVNPLQERIDVPERLSYISRAFDAYRTFAAAL
jgi:arylsulfatase A-like enzyme